MAYYRLLQVLPKQQAAGSRPVLRSIKRRVYDVFPSTTRRFFVVQRRKYTSNHLKTRDKVTRKVTKFLIASPLLIQSVCNKKPPAIRSFRTVEGFLYFAILFFFCGCLFGDLLFTSLRQGLCNADAAFVGHIVHPLGQLFL